MSSQRASSAPQLLSVTGAAELLYVSPRTVLNWIKEDRIPYIELPGNKPTYRIPQHALLATLRGNYDLGSALEGEHEAVGLARESAPQNSESAPVSTSSAPPPVLAGQGD